MVRYVNRREAVFTGGMLIATTPFAAAAARQTYSATFAPMPLPAATMFPRTHYFEVVSAKADAQYGVWITVPKGYNKQPTRHFPAIYRPDGNSSAPLSASIAELAEWDLIDAYAPTIQIAVGYTGADVERSLAVRARDLLPPHEALPDGLEESLRTPNGLLDPAASALYLHNLKNPAADRFLAFLSEELHPFIASRYRVDASNLGLYGYSYGGLFATYAALQKQTIFSKFGAGSPGILPGRSAVFKLYAEAQENGGLSARYLHMTINQREITLPGAYQYMVGNGAVEFMRIAGTTPLKGLNFTSALIENESHATGGGPAAHAFMRTFYLRAN